MFREINKILIYRYLRTLLLGKLPFLRERTKSEIIEDKVRCYGNKIT